MKKAYEEKVQAQLDQWKAEIEKYKAKAEAAKADTKIEYEKRVAELKEKHQQVSDRLSKLRASSDDAWEDIKIGLEVARESLSQAFDSAYSRFK